MGKLTLTAGRNHVLLKRAFTISCFAKFPARTACIIFVSTMLAGCISSRPLSSYLSAKVDDRSLWPRSESELRFRATGEPLIRVGDYWLYPQFAGSDQNYIRLTKVNTNQANAPAQVNEKPNSALTEQTLLLEGRGEEWLGMGLRIADANTFAGEQLRNEAQKVSAVDLSGQVLLPGATPGFDVRRFDALRFEMRFESEGGKAAKVGVHLASYHPERRRSPEVDVARSNPALDITNGQWHSVIVPLDKLLRPSMVETILNRSEGLVDPTAVSEISLGVWSDQTHNFRLYLRKFHLEQEALE